MRIPSRPAAAAAITAATLLLLLAAIWNRFPLTFWDTRAYLTHSMTLMPRVDRVIGYSLYIRALRWTGTLWAIVVVQTAILVWSLWLVARAVIRRPSPARFVLAVAGIGAFTALPWIAGQLMPDLFTPILCLALFLLVLHRGRVSPIERSGLMLVTGVAAAVHVTHAVFGVGLVVGLVLIDWRPHGRRLTGAALAVASITLGLLAMLGFNYSRTHRVELVAGGNAFLLAHLVESGLASELLDRHCAERSYALCPWRASLPMTTDEFLWQNRLPFHPFEQLEATREETRRLLLDSWREHPGSELRVALEYSVGALSRFGTGEGLDSLALPGLDSAVMLVAPSDRGALDSARQQHGGIPVARLRAIDTPVGWVMLLAAVGLVIVGWRRGGGWRRDRAVVFLAAALGAVLLYAVLCGNTSGIYDRYESRLVWLAGFGLWLAVEQAFRARHLRHRRLVTGARPSATR